MYNNIAEMVNTLKQNPMQFFLQHKIPQEYMNDPQGAVQHMIDSGQISPEAVEQAKARARMMGFTI